MKSKQQIEDVLRRLFKGGVIARIPRDRRDAKIFLALAASSFDPRVVYSETAVNEHLLEWMEDITSPASMDHVTVRRYLVDFYLLLRDASGSSYKANQTVIGKIIEPEARSIHPRYILETVQREKEQRKHASATLTGDRFQA